MKGKIMIEEIIKYEEKEELESLMKELPEQCKKCNIYIVTNIKKKKIYCPYLIKYECLIGGIKKCGKYF